ncbi:MAG TPA: hypothetical protein VKE22_19715 [Haliangiales bacterium]|nr:hypothetical protein [Haliangiales bacterium]
MRLVRSLLLVVLFGCSPAPAPAPAPAPEPAHRDLAADLAAEAAGRAGAGPRAEDVLAAFARDHDPVAGTMQVLARPVAARFCLSGRTSMGLGVVVCEYDSEDAARRGRDRSERLFGRAIRNRTLAVRRGALLTLTRPTDDPALALEAGRMVGVFQTL